MLWWSCWLAPRFVVNALLKVFCWCYLEFTQHFCQEWKEVHVMSLLSQPQPCLCKVLRPCVLTVTHVLFTFLLKGEVRDVEGHVSYRILGAWDTGLELISVDGECSLILSIFWDWIRNLEVINISYLKFSTCCHDIPSIISYLRQLNISWIMVPITSVYMYLNALSL